MKKTNKLYEPYVCVGFWPEGTLWNTVQQGEAQANPMSFSGMRELT